jgi:glyoxylase-like metal-dependent hydrolase (beta-lactamase superfamily II)
MSASVAPEVSTTDLALMLERGEPLQIVDVRAPTRVATGRIDQVPEERFHNIVGSELLRRASLADTGLDPALPTVVVCARGNDSRRGAMHLIGLGVQARSLAGGMSAWGDLVLPRALPTPAPLDRLIQFDRVAKGALGYLLVSDGEALVVDAPRISDAYQDAARDAGARIIGVADTHVHADYISGGPDLAGALAVPYYLHPADAVYPYDGRRGSITFTPVAEGAIIPVGRGRLLVRHTPGHTEGSLSFVIDDAAALTGDFMFVESLGRPDLAGRAEEWTGLLWESLERTRREWPDDMMIYPGHYASEGERRVGRAIGDRLGHMRSTNQVLAMTDQAAFRELVLARKASSPEQYRTIKAVNVGLLQVDEAGAATLDVGRNECALGGR